MKHVILIHGSWCNGSVWGNFATDLERMGYIVHTPSLRYHDLPYEEVEAKVGNVSLDDYVDDIVALVESLDESPILLGHSLGCLIAQLVAARIEVSGMILLGPAPTANIFAFYPTMIWCFYKHFLRWGFWRKPMPPYRHAFCNYCMNEQTEADKEVEFAKLVPESGRACTQMAFPMFDKEKGATVDFSKIDCPVLVVTGTKDKMTVSQIAHKTARNYQDATIETIVGSDHMYVAPKFQPQVLETIKRWSKKYHFIMTDE